MPSVRTRSDVGRGTQSHLSKYLTEAACADIDSIFESYELSTAGLHNFEADFRQKKFGRNISVSVKKEHPIVKLIKTFGNPLVILLIGLATVSLAMPEPDYKAATIMLTMVFLGVVIKYVQELKADNAAEKLRAMVSTTATVFREGEQIELPLEDLVPGDLIKLSAGDVVPGDVRIVQAKDLFLNQTALTGEALPVEKFAARIDNPGTNPLELNNICFLGTNVVSGTGMAVIILTGKDTFFGSLSQSVTRQNVVTSFDKGINQVTYLMMGFMAVLVPLVFGINWLTKGNFLEAMLFALSVAVGLTPEMLPMIVTVNLSKGAITLSRQKVIVKNLSSIQNFGAMDILCTDKTGTITQGKVVLEQHLDVYGEDSEEVLNFGYLNSYYQTGLRNMLDFAILEHKEVEEDIHVREYFTKVDEIPFDFVRRRMSVVVSEKDCGHMLICKGAVEETLAVCTHIDEQGTVDQLDDEHFASARELVTSMNEDGFRVLAIAYRRFDDNKKAYSVSDESQLVLLGFLAFLDPPKETASEAISDLIRMEVSVKILTGDNEIVARKVCKEVGLATDNIILGGELENIDDIELAEKAQNVTIFAKLAPAHKERIIKALQARGHVVGFMGDGINDAAALKRADVGISVDTAVDIAKESSDIILLENSLLVLARGVVEGRKVFGNIIKYIKMAASSNFGNMFSVLGASAFLPFLPMLPIQVLVNNLLYDFSQTGIPSDNVDEEWLTKPRKWSVTNIRRFIVYIGPISSIFDYMTFFIMLYVFGCWNNPVLFHTGWFVESLLTQTMIIHVIRTNKMPFVQSVASLQLSLTSVIVVMFGVILPFTPLAAPLGFTALPWLYWPLVLGMMILYVLLTQVVKTWFVRKFGLD
ncbi:MAG: magnesium-translocating P-type ATPase [Caldisericia bacterium]|nr:magnesium-translocating P-type ATPase [Caldisericia bacterium]